MIIMKYDKAAIEISATQAVRTFSEIVNKVYYQADRYDIVRGGTVVASIVPAAPKKCSASALAEIFERFSDYNDPEFADIVEDVVLNQPIEKSPWDR